MHPVVDELLNRWEEARESGQSLSPEELCSDHPELLDELRWQIKAIVAVDQRFCNGTPQLAEGSAGVRDASRVRQVVSVRTQFHIERLYATGGLGEVYLASDPLLNRTVAIKFPRGNQVGRQQLARFQREAQVTGRLNHPGIVPVHAWKQDDPQQLCYVMRFVDGPTLQDRIEQLHRDAGSKSTDFYSLLEVRQLLQNFVALCNIVAYAHDNKFIHRDIKPANIILGMFGETLLMDWGLAKILNAPEPSGGAAVDYSADTVVEGAVQTHAGQFLGTPAYASPEQRSGRTELIDFRSDVYSLGATLLALLTGKLPESQVLRVGPVRNSAGAVLPERLAAICRKAMSESIDQRYSTVAKLREDLECYLAGEPISVVPETLWSRLSRAVRKRSGWAAGILAGTFMAIVAVGVGSLIISQKNQQLLTTNEELKAANLASLTAQQRSAATTQLLTQSMRAATPEVAQGKEPTIRQLLDETSLQLSSDQSIVPLVAADTHQVLADAYQSLGVYGQAQEHARSSHQLYVAHAGENNSDALSAQATLALILSRQDQDDEATRVARDALGRAQASKDIDPRTHAKVLDVAAHVLSRAPNPDNVEIIDLQRSAYDLARAELPLDDPATLRISTNLAVALIDADQLDEGERLLRATKEAHEKKLGGAHPETLVDVFNLMVLLHNKQELAAAAELAMANKQPFEKVFGPNHHRTIRLYLLIGQVDCELGNLATGEPFLREALRRASLSLGPVHQQTLEARGMLCGVLVGLSKLSEAESLANEQYDETRKAFGENHVATVQAVTLLFDMADARHDLEGMSKWLEKLRGSPWERGAQEALQKARQSKPLSR